MNITQVIDIRKAIFFAIILAGLLAAPAVFGHDTGNPFFLIVGGSGGGCAISHSHENSHVCNANREDYQTCVIDSDYHCSLGWVQSVEDFVGFNCQECE